MTPRAIVAAALLALAGAGTAQSPARLLTPDGYGPVRIGMTRAQVSAALHSPLEGEPIEDEESCIELTATRGHPNLAFMFQAGRLTRISLAGAGPIRTERGIGIGSTAAEVRRAYGPRIEAEVHEYLGAPGEYLTWWARPNRRGIRFETDNNRRVDVIHAGDGSVRFIEGCL
ncbi:MAG TPA: hypothetical protein VIT38_11085 [Allosphingosinicella sp.]